MNEIILEKSDCSGKDFLLEKTISIEGEERSYFLYSNHDISESSRDLLIFFHGLEGNGKISTETQKQYSKIGQLAKSKNILSVFPIGLVDSLPSYPNSLGWTPKTFEKNVRFVSRIIEEAGKTSKISSVIFGGFSNGAYFVSQLLNSHKQFPGDFTGYWMQGGGDPIRKKDDSKNERIAIEIGVEDKWHFDHIQTISRNLKDKGWIEGENLHYRELNVGHVLDLSNLKTHLKFFIQGRMEKNKYCAWPAQVYTSLGHKLGFGPASKFP